MKILLVDDERRALRIMEDALSIVMDAPDYVGFTSPTKALDYARKNTVDVAFLDIKMPGINGLLLAKELKEINGTINIIFVTSYSEYAPDAFGLHASGYLLKPIDPQQVKNELENLRNPILSQDQGIRIQCFGNFEVFKDGKPIHFKRSKSKEMLAYLVDRQGASATRKQLAAVLWEDTPYDRKKQKHLQTLIEEMKRALREAGADENIIIQEKGRLSLAKDQVNCDLYAFLRWDTQAVNAYQGEYMSEYSWAEFTAGMLSQRALQKND